MQGITVIENAVKNFLEKEFEKIKPAFVAEIESLRAKVAELEARLEKLLQSAPVIQNPAPTSNSASPLGSATSGGSQ